MKNLPFSRSVWIFFLVAPLLTAQEPSASLPRKYDLRDVGGITPIKRQQGGTCWAHGTMAAIESNLLVSGSWKKIGDGAYPALAEYHLDWWNGFNQNHNLDHPATQKDLTGLRVHQGGDYRVSAAYIARGDGVTTTPFRDHRNALIPLAGIAADPHSYRYPPGQVEPRAKKYYVRDIEWFTIGDNLEGIDAIKRRVISHGAMGTAYCASSGPKGMTSKDFVHYQPKDNPRKPNHAVAMVGWDDDKVSADPEKKLPKPGCWLIKNSWGVDRGDQGFYWISYHDKVCCRDPEMGAVSFRNVEPMRYSYVYYHDYHGWRDTMKDVNKAFNLFTATADHKLGAISFYTAADNVRYTAKIYSKFAKGELQGLRMTTSGEMAVKGLHTVDLTTPINVAKGETFIVCLELAGGGHAFDRTSEIEVLLQQKGQKGKQPAGPRGPNGGPIVISKANAGESFYHDGKEWRDLYEHRFDNPTWATFDRTANFCMKALVVN